MAADYSAYDAGTAYLTIEAKLDDDFEAKLAAELGAIDALPVALAPDIEQFAKDLDKAWSDLDHKLPVQLQPITESGELGEGMEPVKVDAVLNMDQAEAELREFFSLTPIFTIPVELNTDVAMAQLDELRAKAAEPLIIPVTASASGQGPETVARQGLAGDETAGRASAQQILYEAARQNPAAAAQDILGAASNQAPAAAQKLINDVMSAPGMASANLGGTGPATTKTSSSSSGDVDRALARMEQEDRANVSRQYKAGQKEIADRESAAKQAEQDARKATAEAKQPIADLTKWFQGINKDGLKGAATGIPALAGSKDWSSLLGGGEAGGAGAALAAIGALKGALSDIVGPISDAASALTDLTEKTAKYAAIAGAVGLGGGLLADLGAVGITGMFGSKNLSQALSAGQALHQWQIDPNAQIQQQSAVLSAQLGRNTAAQGVEHAGWAQNDALFGAVQAQQQLTQAQEGAVLAQRSLNEAYKDAGRSVRDMNNALTDAKLAQEGAAIAVAQARSSLLQVDMDPGSTYLDRLSAANELAVQQQRYIESKNKTADQSVDTTLSNQRGVSQSTQVLESTKAMQAATFAVQEAMHAQVDAQHQIVAAMEQVANASVQVQLAANNMKLALNPQPVNDYQIALSKLSPSAREFVQQVESMMPELRDLQKALSDAMFSGLADSIKQFTTDQGISIAAAMTGVASAINSGLKNTLQGLDDLFTRMQKDGSWDQFVKGAQDMAKGLAPVITGLVDLLMQLGAKTSPIVGPLMQQIGTTLQDIAPALGDLGKALGQGLLDALPSFTKMISTLAEAAVPVMPALSRLFQDFANILGDIGPDLISIVTSFLNDLAGFLEGLERSGGLKSLADEFANLWKQFEPLAEPLGKLVGYLLPIMFNLITAGLPWLQSMAPEFKKWLEHAGPLVEKITTFAEHALPGLIDGIGLITSPIEGIIGLFETWFGWVDKIAGLLGKLVDPLKSVLSSRSGSGEPPDLADGGMGWYLPDMPHGHAGGGLIRGIGTGTSDSNLAAVSDGEYIINAAAAGAHRPLLDAINYGAPGFSAGGAVSGAFIANDVRGGKYGKALRKIAEKNIRAFATGGPVNAKDWGTSHPNIPYIWGGTDLQGVDCSGYVGLLQQVSMGVSNPDARLGVTGDVVSGSWPRFIKGAAANDVFVIGANTDHMAAQILGTNFEARQPGENVRIGSNAASPFSGQFTVIGHVDPNAFQPAYDATGATGGDSNNAALNAQTDATAAVSQLPAQAPTSWSGWAGNTVTNTLTSLASYGTLVPPANGALPLVGVSSWMANTANAAPKDQQQWLNEFFFGSKTSPGAATNTGTASGTAPGTSTPSSPDAGTQNAPDRLGTDALASSGAGGGVLGALQHAIGGFAKAAGAAVSGQLSSALNVLGGGSNLDTIPGWVRGAYEGYRLYQAATAPQMPSQLVQQSATPDKNKPAATNTTPQTATTVPPGAVPTPSIPAPAPTTPGTGEPLNKMATQQPSSTARGGGDQLNEMAVSPTADAYAAQFGATPELVGTVRGVAAQSGWGSGSQWNALDQLLGHESSWNPEASAEPASDAYGLYQFLSTTWATVGGSKTSDPRLQAIYGDKYIAQKYGDPVSAWAFWQAQSPHWYSSGGDVNGDGSSIGDMIPALLSDGEFVVNAQSADANRGLLTAVNADAGAVNRLAYRQSIPSKGLVGAGTSRGGVDNSATYNIHAHDTEQAFRRAALYQEQRTATYTGRWR